MKVTGRLSTKRIGAHRAIASAGGDIIRQSRVEELRRMVAAGRYRVDPSRLALRILVRSLSRSH